MILHVENLGPLKQASIDLSKDLILFTGPNNTGKTYLAWSVYGMHRMHSVPELNELAKPAVDAMLERGDSRLDLVPFIAEHGRECGALIGRAYGKHVAHDFAIHPDRLRDVRFTLELDVRDAPRQGLVLLRGSAAQRYASRLSLGFMLGYSMLRALLPWSVIFPAERIATNLFAKELSLQGSELVDEQAESPAVELLDTHAFMLACAEPRAHPYPSPIQDSVQVAMELEPLSQGQSPYADLAEEMERTILGGAVAVSAQGQLSFTPAGAPGVDVAIQHAGSVVKSLASLVFYLRHRARKRQFVIIDKPELDLHPDNQRKVARVLAKAVNRGLRVLASTHSDYLIRELNHLIMLSGPGHAMAEVRERLGYDKDSLLAPERLGVYFFDGTGNRELPVDEGGFEVDSIEAAIEDMNATSQAIYAALLDD